MYPQASLQEAAIRPERNRGWCNPGHGIAAATICRYAHIKIRPAETIPERGVKMPGGHAGYSSRSTIPFPGSIGATRPWGAEVNPGSGACARTDRRMSGGGQARAAHWRQGLRQRPTGQTVRKAGGAMIAPHRANRRKPKAQDRRDYADIGAGGRSGACSHGCRTTAVSSPAMSVIAKASPLSCNPPPA